jgi:tRNA A37 threonylcarbamoyladenosine modification protein TsaB
MAIWEKNHLDGAPLAFYQDEAQKPACEVSLPAMWMALSDFHGSIRSVATLTGPGPFTAVRAGLAFAQGLVHGDDQWSLFSTSLFALMPQPMRSCMILDTGGNHWVDEYGAITAVDDVHVDYRISSATCTKEDRVNWSRALAKIAVA